MTPTPEQIESLIAHLKSNKAACTADITVVDALESLLAKIQYLSDVIVNLTQKLHDASR